MTVEDRFLHRRDDAAGDSPPAARPPKRAGNPGRRASQKQVTERIIITARMLVQRLNKLEIKQVLKKKYGIGARMVEAYISRARQYLIEESGKPKDEHIAVALAFYESVIREPDLEKAPLSLKLQAQRDMCTLLGLNAPTKVAPVTPDGAESYTPLDAEAIKVLATDELEMMFRVWHKLQAARALGTNRLHN